MASLATPKHRLFAMTLNRMIDAKRVEFRERMCYSTSSLLWGVSHVSCQYCMLQKIHEDRPEHWLWRSVWVGNALDSNVVE